MTKSEKKIKKVMKKFKKGELNIGGSDKKVKSRKQAIAIAYSMAQTKTFAATEGEIQNDMLQDTIGGLRLMGGIIIATLLIDYALKIDMFKGGLR